MVMIVPIDPNVDKTHYVASEDRKQWPQSSEARVMRSAQLQHHNGDDDGDNAITERFHSARRHVYLLRPMAKRLWEERTYITPSERAGVAMSNSPIEFVAMWLNFSPADTTRISPSSIDR